MTGKALAGCREIPGVTVCQQVLAEKQNVVLRCIPGCKPGAGCLRGAKPRIFVYLLCFAAGEIRHIGYIKKIRKETKICLVRFVVMVFQLLMGMR